MNENYINRIIIFDYENGCIEAGSICYCYALEGGYAWVSFKKPILGRNDLKIHVDVLINHGRLASM